MAAQKGEPSLEEAIANMRVIMDRTLRLSIDTQDPSESMRLLDVYGQAATRLVTLLKAQKAQKATAEEEFNAAVQEAIAMVNLEWEQEREARAKAEAQAGQESSAPSHPET